MRDAKKLIADWIKQRVENHETYQCMFDVTIPQLPEMPSDNQYIKEICGMFDKYGIRYWKVDTIPGSFNLNRDWIETEKETPIECAVEYCGVYPVNWDIDDVVRIDELERTGIIIIRVLWIQDDGKLVDNH